MSAISVFPHAIHNANYTQQSRVESTVTDEFTGPMTWTKSLLDRFPGLLERKGSRNCRGRKGSRDCRGRKGYRDYRGRKGYRDYRWRKGYRDYRGRKGYRYYRGRKGYRTIEGVKVTGTT
ncbi:hypothetical protein Btru_010964 [Bulinus truncatus]|nr:hypothetical protein Btru_010964 [Bulinus truncatus]